LHLTSHILFPPRKYKHYFQDFDEKENYLSKGFLYSFGWGLNTPLYFSEQLLGVSFIEKHRHFFFKLRFGFGVGLFGLRGGFFYNTICKKKAIKHA
jgi:hypothetical protein